MVGQYVCSSFSRVLLVLAIAVHMAACGGGSGSTRFTGDSAGPAAEDVLLTGSVGDGPVTGALVEVWSSSDRLIRTLNSDNTASF
ncbi:MAG TPA: hypothetical protein VET88_10705, partial [Gammaproteobacteria bacterium]|nr:hypothetical protein [Gammaproteobacteria bacterium]